MTQISDLYDFRRMPRDEAVEYIMKNPDEVYEVLCFTSLWIDKGWMKRFKWDCYENNK
jgi:hypothetical protein